MSAVRNGFQRQRRGAALVYVVAVMLAMMGLCSLAVDLGRYEVAHSQLYNAAVSAARAGAASMPYGASTCSASALSEAIANSVDGKAISSGNVTVQYINWSTTTKTGTVVTAANFATANAVRVTITYTVPLAFAQVIGMPSKIAVESSTAMLSMQTASPYVYATGDPWLAGEPAGTHGSQADPNYTSLHGNSDHQYPYDVAGTAGGNASNYNTAEPYSSPVQVAITVTPGAILLFSNVSGTSSYDHGTAANLDATGNQGNNPYIVSDAAANGVSEHGIADATMPAGSLNAVFLGSTLPDNNTAPAPLDFSTQAKRDYVGLQPKLQQPFFVGTGTTTGGTMQQVVVPANATRLFLGVMDGWEWDNNVGGFNVTVTEAEVITVQ